MTTEGTVFDLGLRDYQEVWMLQRRLVDLRARSVIPDTLILVEHPHVFTVGKGVPGDIPNDINGVPVFRIERGGEWTYHGPGQLVGYPILNLDGRKRDVHGFLRNIEETLIRAIGQFGIQANLGDQTGVWVQKEKIASIGAAIRNWISFHGFALNVNTEMSYFGLIEPCGLPSSTMTSMKTLLGSEVEFERVKGAVRRKFEEAFQLQLKEGKRELLEPEPTR
jgi:lipoate-protein ligase B